MSNRSSTQKQYGLSKPKIIVLAIALILVLAAGLFLWINRVDFFQIPALASKESLTPTQVTSVVKEKLGTQFKLIDDGVDGTQLQKGAVEYKLEGDQSGSTSSVPWHFDGYNFDTYLPGGVSLRLSNYYALSGEEEYTGVDQYTVPTSEVQNTMVDVLTSIGLSKTSDEKLVPEVIYSGKGVACISAEQGTEGKGDGIGIGLECAYVHDTNAKAIQPIFAAHSERYQQQPLLSLEHMNSYSKGTQDEYSGAILRDAYYGNLDYYVETNHTWRHFGRMQEGSPFSCDKFDTTELRAVFAGTFCIDSDTKQTREL